VSWPAGLSFFLFSFSCFVLLLRHAASRHGLQVMLLRATVLDLSSAEEAAHRAAAE
jgi:hypothetical protein